MVKPDDRNLTPDQLRAVEKRASGLLNRASGWNRYPTPVKDILEAAQVSVASVGVFDSTTIMEYISRKAGHTADKLKSAISKVFGIYDAEQELIHIDSTVSKSKQNFLKLHEVGHQQIPWHKKLFRIFQDCEKTLSPETADLFEREANNFARFVLFQGTNYGQIAADHALEIKTPMKLAKMFGASIYASCREFARTNHRPCLVYVLEPIKYCERSGTKADVRRIEASPSFKRQFGMPGDTVISLDHPIGSVLPVGRRMSRPMSIRIKDRNGDMHECVMEAFDTTFNVVILLYPIKSLTATTLIVTASM